MVLPIFQGGAAVNTDMKQWAWVISGAVLLGLLSGGLALWTTRLAGGVLTEVTAVLLASIYATGMAAGLLVANAASVDKQ